MVWPWLPIRSTRRGEIASLLHADRAASVYSLPSLAWSWLNSLGASGFCSATRRISLRTDGGKFCFTWPKSLMLRCGGAPEILTSAASIPSADVPDIIPRTNLGLEAMIRVKEIFTTVRTEDTEQR